jgi:photosystem II protein PsbQ
MHMVRYRSFLALVLAAIATFLVSCSGPAEVAPPPAYTPSQLERIHNYEAELLVMRDRLDEIPVLVQNDKWQTVQTLIHGPLGELRTKMNLISRNLLTPAEQEAASQVAREVFEHLVDLDDAAELADAQGVLSNYAAAVDDFDVFLDLIPDTEVSSQS